MLLQNGWALKKTRASGQNVGKVFNPVVKLVLENQPFLMVGLPCTVLHDTVTSMYVVRKLIEKMNVDLLAQKHVSRE